MSAPSKANSTGGVRIVPPLGKGQQVMKVAAQAVVEEKSHDGGFQTSPRLPSAAQQNTEVLHQTGGKLPKIPIRTAIGGFAIVFAIGCFTLGSKKKAEVTALDAAKPEKH